MYKTLIFKFMVVCTVLEMYGSLVGSVYCHIESRGRTMGKLDFRKNLYQLSCIDAVK